jgi:DNA polymerase sigma
MREQTVAKVASCIQNNFCHEYRVEVFGSTQYGVDGQTSDLDMVVIVGISFNVSSSE